MDWNTFAVVAGSVFGAVLGGSISSVIVIQNNIKNKRRKFLYTKLYELKEYADKLFLELRRINFKELERRTTKPVKPFEAESFATSTGIFADEVTNFYWLLNSKWNSTVIQADAIQDVVCLEDGQFEVKKLKHFRKNGKKILEAINDTEKLLTSMIDLDWELGIPNITNRANASMLVVQNFSLKINEIIIEMKNIHNRKKKSDQREDGLITYSQICRNSNSQ